MKKLLLVICLVTLSTACTMRKEGGTWTVKKTIVDEVKESAEGASDLVTDVKDANEDLSNASSEPEAETEAGTEQ